jgi:dethiobiotin synthetase
VRGLFVTGTDTGVGKTFVSCVILRALRERGRRIGVYKPAETGCPRDESGALYGEDCVRLVKAAEAGQPLATVASALYPIPAAPLVSADAAGEAIDPDTLVRDARAVADAHEAVLVEGAGGLLVPIAAGFTFADLAERLGLPVLVVVGSKLGCLNHALLTLAELERRGLRVVGSVMNGIEPEGSSEFAHAVATHRETLARFTKVADLGELPHAPEAELGALGGKLDLAAIALAMGI